MSSEKTNTCDICRISSSSEQQDVLVFGDWMNRNNITVHYYCLLLSWNLPQNGGDAGGILGFLLKDIRKEIQEAAQRSCCFCNNKHASIRCYTCSTYFHLDCGYKNGCLFRFHDDFRSYCDLCFPLDEHQQKTSKNPPKSWCCAICQGNMTIYKPYNWIYAKCCGNGWVHRVCIQKYALSAGYYLRCIWCKDQSFRNSIRLQGIFVPDRDANWEREKGAYSDLHRGYDHCDLQPCVCMKGRDYKSPSGSGNWRLIVCSLCGSYGAHFGCLINQNKNFKPDDHFKCEVCKAVENSSLNTSKFSITPLGGKDKINHSVFMQKTNVTHKPEVKLNSNAAVNKDEDKSSTTQESTKESASQEPIENQNQLGLNPSTEIRATPADFYTQIVDVENTQSQDNGLEEKDTQLVDDIDNQETQQIPYNSLGSSNVSNTQQEHFSHSIQPENISNEKQDGPRIIETSNVGDRYHIFEAYKLVNSDCVGSITFCVDRSDPRFKDLTIEQIEKSNLLDAHKDSIRQTKDRGIFDILDDIIAKHGLQ